MAHPGRAGALVLLLLASAAACGDDDPSESATAPAVVTTVPGEAADVADLDRLGFETGPLATVAGTEGAAAVVDGVAVVDGARRVVVTTVYEGRRRRAVDTTRPPLLGVHASWEPPRLILSGDACPGLPVAVDVDWEYSAGTTCEGDPRPTVRTLDVTTGVWAEVPLDAGRVDAVGGGTAVVARYADGAWDISLADTAAWTETPAPEGLTGPLGPSCPLPGGGAVVIGAGGAFLVHDGKATPVDAPGLGHCDGDGGLIEPLPPGGVVPATLSRVRVAPDGSTTRDQVALPAAALDPEAWTVDLAGTPTGAVLYVGATDGPALWPWLLGADGTWTPLESTGGPDDLQDAAVVDGALIGLGGPEVRVLS